MVSGPAGQSGPSVQEAVGEGLLPEKENAQGPCK